MKFYLVRHVETTGNIENRFAGVTETSYTEKGKKQFEIITKKLSEEIEFDKIYSSPISRAKKIACTVGERKNMKVDFRNELSEMNFGIFENLTFETISTDKKEYWEKWNEDYINYKIPNGDSLTEFHGRIASFTDSIKNQPGSSLVVCHGGTIQSILTHLLDLDITHRWHFFIPLAGLVEINYENGFGIINRLTRMAEIE
ncbi:histidine phosphatase family protein [Alkalibacter mobilis]|uniref:histidine phosphatase family protein n=1 Tax=Alkalibacter mobilis TaxID=2787712 RepID=UPI00189CC5AB|nr:histidine phosphatase family protein [Alkalibacter mobilis]MBF7096872.1 histidine phosphatase family protein [Alkalibacter mobilis]